MTTNRQRPGVHGQRRGGILEGAPTDGPGAPVGGCGRGCVARRELLKSQTAKLLAVPLPPSQGLQDPPWARFRSSAQAAMTMFLDIRALHPAWVVDIDAASVESKHRQAAVPRGLHKWRVVQHEARTLRASRVSALRRYASCARVVPHTRMPTTSSSSRGGKMQASRERAKGARTDACEVPHLSWKKKNVVAAEPCTSCDGARTWPKTARSTGSPRIHPEFLGLEGELSAAAGRDYLTTATATQLLVST
ncbi:hypothetical protein PCL_08557 [Purpureocillium lilacinum]|uniref:Uncharacterized protein n=1 Tax=Purpureocillium lilacinum TaxID=33203 RepID=A0A2U3DR85_PURLI|nr:hypothetical protein PCL_08557 [Purpureocillium lilacinum]